MGSQFDIRPEDPVVDTAAVPAVPRSAPARQRGRAGTIPTLHLTHPAGALSDAGLAAALGGGARHAPGALLSGTEATQVRLAQVELVDLVLRISEITKTPPPPIPVEPFTTSVDRFTTLALPLITAAQRGTPVNLALDGGELAISTPAGTEAFPIRTSLLARILAKMEREKRAPITADDLDVFGRPHEDDLRRWVYSEQVAGATLGYLWGIPQSDLLYVGDEQLRKDVVPHALALMAQARRDAPASLKFDVGIASGYRDARKRDFRAWKDAFTAVYGSFFWEREKVKPGAKFFYKEGKVTVTKGSEKEFSPSETRALLEHMIGQKAAAGHSNHNRGIAIDFWFNEGGKHFGIGNGDWAKSWFWKTWLDENAGDFGFVKLRTEKWHWDYRPDKAVPKHRRG